MSEPNVTFIVRAPALVEDAVRATLRSSLALRALRASAIDPRTFANFALDELERSLGEDGAARDAVGRHELKGATLRAAATFAASSLARRLFALPPDRLVGRVWPSEIDVVVRDRRARLHAVRLETCGTERARAALLARVSGAAAELPGTAERIVHAFSLRDGRLRSCEVSAASRVAAGNGAGDDARGSAIADLRAGRELPGVARVDRSAPETAAAAHAESA